MLNLVKITPVADCDITHLLVSFTNDDDMVFVLSEESIVNIETGETIRYKGFVVKTEGAIGIENIFSAVEKALKEVYKANILKSITPVWLLDVYYQEYPPAK